METCEKHNRYLERMKNLHRELRLEKEKNEGRPRSNSWGGKKSHKQERKSVKNSLRNWY